MKSVQRANLDDSDHESEMIVLKPRLCSEAEQPIKHALDDLLTL